MSNSETQPFQKSLLQILKDTGIYVPVVIAFITWVFGLAPAPYTTTTATLAILIPTLLLAGIRLPQITRRKDDAPAGGILVVGEPRKTIPFWSRAVDPLRTHSIHSYIHPLFRRRVEILLIVGLLVFSIINAIRTFRDMQDEFLGLQDCFGSRKEGSLFVVIAEFSQSDTLPKIEIVENLHDHLISNLDEKRFRVCRSSVNNPIKLRVDALELADKTKADMIIWGSRNIAYKVHIELPNWDRANSEVSNLPADETGDFNFIELETRHLGYLTEFTLSEILFEAGEVEEAQQRIEEALARAEMENLGVSIPNDLAEGYFLKGLMFDLGTVLGSGQNPSPNLEKSIQAYSRSVDLNKEHYAARLNLGNLHQENGETDKAFEDFTQLILDPNSPFIAIAYINRSALQPTREATESDLTAAIELSPAEGYFFRAIARREWGDVAGALADFASAIAEEPDNPIPYHVLGMFQLEEGMYEDARHTYETLALYLDDEFRETVIDELNELGESQPETKAAVAEIIKEALKK